MSGSVEEALPAVLAVLSAPILASFFATLADRWPRGERIAAGRSLCRSCGQSLHAIDLVPLVSYLALRGRCRHCGAPFPRWLFAFELAALLLGVQAAVAFDGSWLAVAATLLGVSLLAIAVIDLRHYFIPDIVSLPLLMAGLAVAAAAPGYDLPAHALGAALGFLLLMAVRLIYRGLRGREGLGQGDAKLLAAGGAWVGWQGLPFVLLIASLSGLLVVLLLRLRGRVLAAGDALPFGPFLAIGLWLVWLYLPPA